MAYYSDISPYKVDWLPNNFTSLSIGWLDNSHSYATGFVDELLINKLWEFCLIPMIKYRGYHSCQLCVHPQVPILARREEKQLSLGAANLIVLGEGDFLYVVPDLIYHYIIDHNYLPPQEFLTALIESPMPDSSEYQSIRSFYFQRIRNLRERLGHEEKTA